MSFNGIPDGAVFEEKELEGNRIYAYTPSEMYYSLTSMLNRFYYYPDAPITDIDEAWEAIHENGLVQLAEENMAAVIVLSSVDGEDYGQGDYDFWLELSQKLSATARGEESFMSYGSPLFNKSFMTGEVRCASFCNKMI